MIDQSNREFHLPFENAEVFTRITELLPDPLESLIKAPKNALVLYLAEPQISNAGFAAIWQGHDVWVDRMCRFLWIRSPALEFTLQNAQERYRQFFDLLASDPNKNFVPPPDVELVWLTHHTSPVSFEKFSKATMGRIMEHNIIYKGETDQEGLRATEEAWQALFETKLQRCLCWDCQNFQRLAEAHFRSERDREPQHLVDAAIQEVAHHRAIERAKRIFREKLKRSINLSS